MRFIEEHALFTRTGPQGIRQVNVTGLVATAFTHRDSRAGDPDLHTHVAVANKVQTLDGRWLSIDGRVLFKAKVAASETYNTSLEQHLRGHLLGVRFAERLDSDRKRPIRRSSASTQTEPALVHPPRPSTTSASVSLHAPPPLPWPPTHACRSALGPTGDLEHRSQTRTPLPASNVARPGRPKPSRLGGPPGRQPWSAGHCPAARGRRERWMPPGSPRPADRVLAEMEEHRSTWRMWHVRAEAQRHVRAPPTYELRHRDALVDLLVDGCCTVDQCRWPTG